MSKKILIYTDGGSRGNPGPAAAGYTLNGEPCGVYLGRTTNNVAEYTAIKLALEAARKKAGEHAWETTVEVRMDSQLAQRQLLGQYKMKNAGLRPIFEAVQILAKHFKEVRYVHVPREENAAADAAVNKALDEQQ
jgi:ribonuclease HI